MVQIVVIYVFWAHVYSVLCGLMCTQCCVLCVVDLEFLSCRLFLSAVLRCH